MRSGGSGNDDKNAEWTMSDNDEWPDPEPSPPLVEQLTNWLKRSAKSFLNLFGGYIFMAAAWVAFFYAAFYASFFLVGATQAGMSAGIWEVMRIGGGAVMTSLSPLGDVMGGFVGSIGIVMFAGGAISLWAYGKLKQVSKWTWKRMVERVR
jgi:hypothetical protein